MAEERRHVCTVSPEAGTLCQELANLSQKLAGAIRLGHKIVAARRTGFLLVPAQGIGRDRNNGDRAQRVAPSPTLAGQPRLGTRWKASSVGKHIVSRPEVRSIRTSCFAVARRLLQSSFF